ncbi:hypothetical protein BDY24DRAFT_441318 [Mrakia frigida]|uniref:uncharacterized protein n=1 Tax=Mrakia frigida TaxID=29902 RepID=UPI003FCC01C5
MIDSLFTSTLGIRSSHLTPLAIFIGYFVLIAYLFVVVLRATVFSSSTVPAKGSTRRSIWATIFALIAVGSFGHTWYHMINYMIWSHSNAISLLPPSSTPLPPLLSITTWLSNTALFEQAWSIVLQPGPKAWISSHITSFTVNWVLFLWMSIQPPCSSSSASTSSTEGKEKNQKEDENTVATEKHWGAYEAACVLLLGQVVAISVASSLWFVGCARRGKSSAGESGLNKDMVPRKIWIPLMLSSLSAAVVPMTVNTQLFLPNLLLLHFLLLLPFILPSPPTPSSSELYVGALALSFLLPLPTFFLPVFLTKNNLLLTLLPSNRETLPLYFPSQAWETYLTSNHAVGSITADVAWCTIVTLAWAWYTGRFFMLSLLEEDEEMVGWKGRGWWVVRQGGKVLEGMASVWGMWVFGSPGFL